MAHSTPPVPSDLLARCLGQTLLIVGSAPTLHADHAAALELRPGAHTLLINEAGAAIAQAEHLYAGHLDKAGLFARYRREQLLGAPRAWVHGCADGTGRHPAEVDFVWEGVQSGATSAWTAVRVGRALGYAELILCGCPLDPIGYFNPEDTHRFRHDCPRVGLNGDSGLVRKYRRRFEQLARDEGADVRSMSGWTGQLLGLPA